MKTIKIITDALFVVGCAYWAVASAQFAWAEQSLQGVSLFAIFLYAALKGIDDLREDWSK